MADLSILDKATIDDDTDHALPGGPYSCISSDPAVATAEVRGGYWYAVAASVGSTTITATRLADGATGTLEVDVIPAPGAGTFEIRLGAASPR